MAITTTSRQTTAFTSGNNFAFGFKVFNTSDVKVIQIDTTTKAETILTLTSNYTVTLNDDQDANPGGTVTLVSGGNPQNLGSGLNIVITSKVEAKQQTELTNQGGFFPEVINDSLDKAVILLQQQQAVLDKTIKFPLTDSVSGLEVTGNPTDRAKKVLSFDSSGNLDVQQEIGTFKGNWAAGTGYVVRDIVKDTSTNNIFFCNTAHTSSGAQPLTTNANSANWDLIVDAATATTSSTNAASSASAAATSATNAANSATAAATSETNAASSASTATTKATQADTAKTAAETAKTAAETAQAAAETALDAFDDRYLGAKSSDPSVDNDGDALLDGALYFNTTDNVTKVYDSGNSVWRLLKISDANQAKINTVEASIANVNTVGNAIANVNAVAGNATNINNVAGNSSNINTVANNNTNVNTVAGNNANVSTVASDITSVNTVATEINNNNLQTVASNINAVKTAADDLNEATSEIDTVANAITNVDTVGNNISNVNTVAGISSDVTAVSGNNSNVTAVANNSSNINSAVSNASNINAAVANQTNINAAVSNATDISAVAANNSNITAVAGNETNINAVKNNETNINAVNANKTNIDAVAGNNSNITAVAGNASNINAVAADATDIGAVAGKATEIGRLGTADAVADLAILGTTDVVADLNTLATSAIVSDMDTLADISSNITTVAGISSNVTAVAGNATNINAVQANATNINAVAGNNSNITAVANNQSNINAVAADASDIGIVAADGTDIGLVAGSISSVNTTAGSIGNVNTVASNISNVNSFAGTYQIASSDPSTDGAGNSLSAGDLYFNTSINELKVYTGSAWQSGATNINNFLAKAGGQMTGNITFSGSQTVDGRDVSVDGAKLDTIESNAKDDQTASEIKTLLNSDGIVNSNVDANAAIDGSKISPAFTSDITGTGNLTLTSTDASSSAAPEFELYRNSSSPADADYLGQLKFTGENSAGGKQLYAKITGKIDDVTNGTEDGIIEITHVKNGSNNISARFTSTALKLINGTALEVAGGADITGNITVSGTVDGVDIAANNTLLGGLTNSNGALLNGVTAATQGTSDNTTKVATTAFVTTAINNLINGAPGSLDTLNELAAAMADDAAFSTTVTNSLATKLNLSGGQITGNITCSGSQTIDGRDLSVDGAKLDGIAANAIDGSSLNASNLSSGTIPDARFPSTLPAISGANLTNLPIPSNDKITEGNTEVEVIDTGSNGHIKITTEGSERFRIDSSGRVMIGTTSVGQANADDLTIGATDGGGNGGITIRGTNNSIIYFSDATGANDTGQYAGYLVYDHSSNKLNIGTNQSARLSVTSSGHFLPWSDSTNDIGSNTVRFANGYFDTLYGDGSNLTNVAFGLAFDNQTIKAVGTTNLRLLNSGSVGIKIDNATDAILPTHGSAINIGSSSDKFKQVHATHFYGDGSNLTNLPSASFTSIASNVVPDSNNQRNLGLTGYRWDNIYANYMWVTNEMAITTIQANSGGKLRLNNQSGVGIEFPNGSNDILPTHNNATDFGSSSKRFDNIYANNFYGGLVEVESGILNVKNTGTQSEMRLYCESNNAHYASLKAPAHSSFSGNLTYTLPSSYGSNAQVLTTDGSGGTSWTTPASSYTNSSVDSHLNTGSASSSQVLSWNGSDYAWVAQSSGGGGGLSSLVADTSPQLGGTLDANGQNIDMGTNVITDAKVGQWDTTYSAVNSSAASSAVGVRKIYASTSTPSGGSDGDLWVKYTP